MITAKSSFVEEKYTAQYYSCLCLLYTSEAESKAHNVPVDQVHFHEVGAVDSIVDIVSVAVCLDDLDVTEVIVPVLWEGRGTVRCQHGILPIPVPAVANIVSANHLYLKMTEVEGDVYKRQAVSSTDRERDCRLIRDYP